MLTPPAGLCFAVPASGAGSSTQPHVSSCRAICRGAGLCRRRSPSELGGYFSFLTNFCHRAQGVGAGWVSHPHAWALVSLLHSAPFPLSVHLCHEAVRNWGWDFDAARNELKAYAKQPGYFDLIFLSSICSSPSAAGKPGLPRPQGKASCGQLVSCICA